MKDNSFSPMEDGEFLEGIWRKARYLEYLKAEEETVRLNKINIYKKKIKTILWLCLCTLFIAVPLVLAFGLSLFSILIIGSILLGEGTFYEYIQSSNSAGGKS